jgi:outer membrane protein assembly factor BamB
MPACLDLGAIALWTVAAPPELSSTVIVDMKVGPGGIVALGQSSSAVAVASLAASDGHTAWARAFPTGPWGVGPHALPTLDGAGAVVVLGMVGAHTFDGTTIDTGPGGFAIVRLDGNGHVVWGHTLGQLPGVWQTTLARVPGGPLMIAGTMDPAATTTASLTFGPFSLPAAAKTGFLVTIDDDGTYGSAVTPAAAPTALVPADGGAFAWIGGKNQSFGKLTSAGDLAWSVAAPDVSAVAMIGPDPLLGQAWSPQGVLVRLSSSTGAPVWSLPVAGMGPVDLRTDLTATGDVLSTAVDYGPYTNYPRLHLSRVSPSGALVYHHTTTTCAALQGAPTLVAEGQALVVTPQKPGLSFSLIAL